MSGLARMYTPVTDLGPLEFPPIWARRWGHDATGLFAEIVLGEQSQRFRWIEKGSFIMGSPENEKGRVDDEGPQHRVHLRQGFWMADTACSNGFLKELAERANEAITLERSEHLAKMANLPATEISWREANEWAHWLERDLKRQLNAVPAEIATDDFKIGLPTEAQWEYACRAGGPRDEPFNTGETISKEQANFEMRQPIKVKSFEPNLWGLYQMHGNVWEWCLDTQRKYKAGDMVDPGDPFAVGGLKDRQAMPGEKDNSPRVLRGGSWFLGARLARSAYRDAGEPGDRIGGVGFRLVLRSLGPKSRTGRPGGLE
jgi:formylglycine-generating enzyme